MLIFPYKADVPVDHRPWGTLGLIGFTIGVAILLGFPEHRDGADAPFVNALVLRFGTFNPVQWATSIFVHLGWAHVLSNMLFLWWFGLAVEGLIGWRRFVPLYVATGAASGGATQILMLGADGGGAAGASGAIFGMMVIAALWAPRNTFSTFLWIFVFVRWTEMSVLSLATIFVVLELAGALLLRFSMSSEVMHLLGAASGLAFGMGMLRKGWVDTGGWDWFSLRRGRPTVIVAGPGVAPHGAVTGADALARIRDDLDQGNGVAADARYESARKADPSFALPRGDFLRLVEALSRSNALDAAIDRMEEFVGTHPDGSAPVRLALARLLVQAKRPRRALDQLAALEPSSDTQREAKAALEAEAQAAVGTAGLELE